MIATKRTLVAATTTQKDLPVFFAGDIILFAGKDDLYSRFTRWLMRTSGEGSTYAVHTAQFLDEQRILEMDVVGRIKTVDDILNKRVDFDTWERRGFEVWRAQSLTAGERLAITHQALAYTDVRFGTAKFFMHLLDGLVSKIAHKDLFFFRRLDRNNRYTVCSAITAASYDRALSYRFGVPPECAESGRSRALCR